MLLRYCNFTRVENKYYVRGNIGVVPQDTVLFNESIMYNLSYGKIGVTQAFMSIYFIRCIEAKQG